jgi:hypothetical protein
MALKVKVGLSKKVGQPDFGSLGASCDIELELDGGLLFHDLDGLQEKVRTAYVACRQAVNDELANQRRTEAPTSSEASARTNGHNRTSTNGHSQQSGSENGSQRTNGQSNGHSTNGKHRPATKSQVGALHAIATRQGFNLTDRLKERFNIYRAEDLSISEASRLIDELNAGPVPAGTNGSGGHR